MEALFELKNVTKVYESAPMLLALPRIFQSSEAEPGRGEPHGIKVTAVKNLSLEFKQGEFAAIAGPSGSGKTTLLNLIGTLDSPTHGEIRFLGKRISHLAEKELADLRLSHMGFIFQSYNLIPVLTALENVEYVLRLQGVARTTRRAKAMEVLRQMGLEKLSDRRPNLLSGGQQQRVAIARAIVHRPTVVLADEPTANLDSKTAGELMDLMQSLNLERKITFIFSSHDPLVLSRAGRVVEIRDGMLI